MKMVLIGVILSRLGSDSRLSDDTLYGAAIARWLEHFDEGFNFVD